MSRLQRVTCDLCKKESEWSGTAYLPDGWVEGKIELFDETPTFRFNLCPECRGPDLMRLPLETRHGLMRRLMEIIRK